MDYYYDNLEKYKCVKEEVVAVTLSTVIVSNKQPHIPDPPQLSE